MIEKICNWKQEAEKNIEAVIRRAKEIDLTSMPDELCYECTGYNLDCIFYEKVEYEV